MKILSIDTASDICGVSILEDTTLIKKLDQNTGRTHSENLMPMIEQIFEQTHLSLKDIDLLVCDRGPGSFTGIRIGIATTKAFHDSLSIPCVGVSSLEALAYSIATEGFIVSLLDCKNDNCYFALYQLKNDQYIEILPPTADTIENALTLCQQNLDFSIPITFVGDGAEHYKDRITNQFENAIFSSPDGSMLDSYLLGLAGFTKWKKNQFESILPLYLRKPQAQRQLEEKSKAITITAMSLEDLTKITDTLTTNFDDFWSPTILKEELEAQNSHYFAAKSGTEILGFAGIKVIEKEADMMNIVVKKTFRNQGIATLLLQKLIQFCQEQSIISITLEVMEENCPALHLYEKLDFKKIGLRKNYYQGKNAILMKKEMSQS